MDAIFFYPPRNYPWNPFFIVEDLQSNFASKRKETKKKPRHVFHLFLSYNKIDKTPDHFLRKCISADLTLPNVLQISENQNVVCRKI